MSQQPQVTTVSDPVAPNGDAAYISATTAPPSFVFKPGATFPNGGPVQQNTYNTAGLALLSGILKGAGLFPNIGLPASLVDLDFSLSAGSFAATGDIDFGANCSLRGLSTQPTLALGAHQLTTAPRLLKDVRITGTGAGPVFGSVPKLFELQGQSQVSGTNLFTIPNGVNIQVRVSDESILGDSINPSITIPNGANITVYLEDFSSLELNALSFTGSGSGTIFVGANAFIHPDYFTLGPNVSIITTPVTAPEVTYQPGGTAGSTIFTDFDALTAFIASQSTSSELVDWLIRVDGSLVGGTAVVPAGTYDFTGGPASLTFDGGDTMSDLSFDAETTILGLTKITFRNTVVSSANAVNPVWAPISEGTLILENASLRNTDVSYFMTATGAIFALAQSNGGSFGWGSHCIFVDNGSFLVVGLFDVAGGATTFPVAADAFVTFTTPESTFLELDIYSPSILLDHSWFTKAGVCFFYAAPPPFVTFKPGAANTSNVFDDITQVAGYLTSVNFAPNFAPVVNNWSIQIDLTASGNSFTSAVAIDLSLATKLYGILINDVAPTLTATATMGSFDGEIRDIQFVGDLAAPGRVFGPSPQNFRLTGSTVVTCNAGTTLYLTSGVAALTLTDTSGLGDGTNPCIEVDTGSTLVVWVRPGATLAANVFTIGAGGQVVINVLPGGNVDFSYNTEAQVSLQNFIYPPGTSLVFQPGGPDTPPNMFSDEIAVSEYADEISGPLNLYFDFINSGNAFTTTSNITVGDTRSYIGVPDPLTGTSPTLTLNFQISNPIRIEDLNITSNFTGVAFPSVSDGFLAIGGSSFIQCNPGCILWNVLGNASLYLFDDAGMGDGTNPVIHVGPIAQLIISLGGNGTGLGPNVLSITPGGTVLIVVNPGAFLDDSYIGMSGVTIFNNGLRSPIAIGNLGAQATNTGAIAIGDGSICTGPNAISLGPNNNVSGDSAVAIGASCANPHIGAVMFGSGAGQSGIVNYVANVVSNAVVVFSNIGPSFVPASDTTYSVQVRITATQAGGAGSPGTWVYDVLCRNVAGTLTIFNQLLTSDVTLQNGNTCTFAFSVSGTQLVLSITGVVALTYHAGARYDWVEALN